MPSKRRILEHMLRRTLRELVDAFELEVPDRRVKQDLVDGLAASRRASLDDILDLLDRNELKALCRALGLDDRGRAKADLADRILGRESTDGRPTHPTKARSSSAGSRETRGPATQRPPPAPPRPQRPSPPPPSTPLGGPRDTDTYGMNLRGFWDFS